MLEIHVTGPIQTYRIRIGGGKVPGKGIFIKLLSPSGIHCTLKSKNQFYKVKSNGFGGQIDLGLNPSLTMFLSPDQIT